MDGLFLLDGSERHNFRSCLSALQLFQNLYGIFRGDQPSVFRKVDTDGLGIYGSRVLREKQKGIGFIGGREIQKEIPIGKIFVIDYVDTAFPRPSCTVSRGGKTAANG